MRLGDLVRPNFTVVREDDVAFDVITTIWSKRAAMAIVVSRPREEPQRVLGVITKEHVADTVARSVEVYPR